MGVDGSVVRAKLTERSRIQFTHPPNQNFGFCFFFNINNRKRSQKSSILLTILHNLCTARFHVSNIYVQYEKHEKKSPETLALSLNSNQSVLVSKCSCIKVPCIKVSLYHVSKYKTVLVSKCPCNKVSLYQSVLVSKFSCIKVSFYQSVLVSKCSCIKVSL